MTTEQLMAQSTDFMVAEFNAIQQRAVQKEQSRSTATNLFLIIVAAALAGLPGILQLVSAALIPIMLGFVLTFIFTAGCATLEYSINESVVAILLHRRAGRIRRWFVEQNPIIEGYMPFEPSDDKPAIYIRDLHFRGTDSVAFIINIASAALLASLPLSYISWPFAVVGAIITAGATWWTQNAYTARKLKRAEVEVQHRIKFPLTKQSNVQQP